MRPHPWRAILLAATLAASLPPPGVLAQLRGPRRALAEELLPPAPACTPPADPDDVMIGGMDLTTLSGLPTDRIFPALLQRVREEHRS